MATYNGWTELREYRVWAAEDVYACVTVTKHRNGWFHVYEDGPDGEELKTRSEGYAYRYAMNRAEIIHDEAVDACPCHGSDYDQWEKEECESDVHNVYGSAHSVRTQVVDMVENRELESYEL